MAKGKRTQQAQTPQDGVPATSILDDLGIAGAEKGKTEAETGGEPSTKELLAQISALTATVSRVQEENRELSRSQAQFFSGIGSAKPVEAAPQVPGVDLTGLPDPLTDKDGFSKGLNERLKAAITQGVQVMTQAERASIQAQQAQQEKADELWNDFTEAYPDLEPYEDFVEVATRKVIKQNQRRGVNVQALIQTRPDSFFRDVAAETKRILGPVLTAKDEGDDAGDDTQGGEDEGNRTGGIFGGINTGGQPAKGADAPKDPGLVADIKEIQKATGFF